MISDLFVQSAWSSVSLSKPRSSSSSMLPMDIFFGRRPLQEWWPRAGCKRQARSFGGSSSNYVWAVVCGKAYILGGLGSYYTEPPAVLTGTGSGVFYIRLDFIIWHAVAVQRWSIQSRSSTRGLEAQSAGGGNRNYRQSFHPA